LAPAGDKNISAFLDEPLCRGEAYTAVSAGDHSDFSVKSFWN
jgi:hypothetical protein